MVWVRFRRLPEQFRQVKRIVDQDVWGDLGEGVGGEAVGYAAGPEAGVAAGLDVDGGVADDEGLVGRDSGFVQDGLRSLGGGLFGGEAVASVDADEEMAQAEGLHNIARRVDGLVGEDGH